MKVVLIRHTPDPDKSVALSARLCYSPVGVTELQEKMSDEEYNKLKKGKIIFGYTLSGIQFAKSEYGSYDNISFTKRGNIITVNEEKELNIL